MNLFRIVIFSLTLFMFSTLAFTNVNAQLPYTQSVYAYDSLMNVVYGVDTDYAGNPDTLKLDIYKPLGDNNCLRPIMILVHGGSWIGGSKEDPDLVYMSRNLAKKGWVVANINWRLGTHKTSNYSMYALCNTGISEPCAYIADSSEIIRANYRGMQDAKGAIRFMKDRFLTDSTDIDNCYIAGESAGGFVSMAVAFMDNVTEKPADCGIINDAPLPDSDLITYNCIPPMLSYSRPDLGTIEGNLNLGFHDARVKGVGNFFGAVFDLNMFQQQQDTPYVYLYHQGSDVIVNYGAGRVLERISWECYAQTNLCQSYYFYPYAFGSEYISQYFDTIGYGSFYTADIIHNYAYLNNCLSNGHSIDNIQVRLQNMVDFFALKISASGNNPAINCNPLLVDGINNEGFFRLYPNPTNDIVSVLSNRSFSNINYQVTDQSGRVLISGKLLNNDQKIDLGVLSGGVYFFQAGDTMKIRFRIIKY